MKMNHYHLALFVHERARKYQRRTVLKYRDFSEKKWREMSWIRFSEQIMKTAQAMTELGIQVNDRVAVYSQNMKEYLITDFGGYANRAIMVPIYATSSPAQVEYIVNDAEVKVIFVGEQFQYNNAFIVQQKSDVLQKIVIFDRSVVLKPEDKTSIFFDDFVRIGENSHAEVAVNVRMKEVNGEDTACIIYTSGTTGEPKGVVLTHATFMEVFRIHQERLHTVSDKDVSMNFLPLAHIFERAWTFFALYTGMTIAINQDAKEIQRSIKQIHPTIMCSVPRFWEKVFDGVSEKINTSKGLMKWVYTDSIKTGRKYNLDFKNKGRRAPLGTRLKFWFYNNTVFRILKTVIGIENGNIFPCAGAPISNHINEFLHSVNIPLVVGYGLTETCATVSFCPLENFVIGSVGSVMPGIQVKVDPSNNEILVKGKTVMKEYYKKPEATAQVFTEDGFFRTGDAGTYEGGVLSLTDRIKDLYKTANGKYIAPQAIETRLGIDKYIDMVCVIGDERKFVSALIVPNYPAIEEWAESENIQYDSMAELLEKCQLNAMLAARVELLQADLASYEKVKRFTLLPEPFTMEGGELTNTLKVKRKAVAEKYKDVIDKMYLD